MCLMLLGSEHLSMLLGLDPVPELGQDMFSLLQWIPPEHLGPGPSPPVRG